MSACWCHPTSQVDINGGPWHHKRRERYSMPRFKEGSAYRASFSYFTVCLFAERFRIGSCKPGTSKGAHSSLTTVASISRALWPLNNMRSGQSCQLSGREAVQIKDLILLKAHLKNGALLILFCQDWFLGSASSCCSLSEIERWRVGTAGPWLTVWSRTLYYKMHRMHFPPAAFNFISFGLIMIIWL